MPTARKAMTFTVLLAPYPGERISWGLTDDSLTSWTQLGTVTTFDHQDIDAIAQAIKKDLVKVFRARIDS